MHAAFLAVQYDSNDNDLLMKCKSMINRLCKEHFMMPGLEVGCSLYHLLQIVKVATISFFISLKEGVHRLLKFQWQL